jgi:hypothetical protein
MLWSVIFTTLVYGVASIWAYIALRKHTWALSLPLLFISVGALTGFLGGSIFGILHFKYGTLNLLLTANLSDFASANLILAILFFLRLIV